MKRNAHIENTKNKHYDDSKMNTKWRNTCHEYDTVHILKNNTFTIQVDLTALIFDQWQQSFFLSLQSFFERLLSLYLDTV